MSKPRILFLDLETSHNLVATFSLFSKAPIPHGNILKESYVILACWQWAGEEKVYSGCLEEAWRDKATVKRLVKLLAEADAVVAHNLKKFDLPTLRSRALKHGLTVPPVIEIDTLEIARSKFRFMSNRLDYLGSFFGLGRKMHTRPDLWLDVIAGDKAALRDMETYCAQDIRLLSKVYDRLLPYLPATIVRKLFGQVKCGECGSRFMQKRGVRKAMHRMQCQECGTWRSVPIGE